MHVDASNSSCGGVLLQKFKSTDKYFHPVAYCSRKFSRPEQNLSTTEREALGILYCADRWRKYILGRRVVVYTDHISLTSINNLKTQNAKLQRWSIRLSEFQFIYIHRSGSKHKDAEAFSLNAIGDVPPDSTEPAEFPLLYLSAQLDLQTLDIASEQLTDPFCKPIIEFSSTESQDTTERVQRLAQMFTIDNGILYHVSNDQWGYRIQHLVLPKTLWTQVCETVHDHRTGLAHLGFKKCLEVIHKRFYWKGMARNIRQYVGSCHTCQTRNPGRSEKYGLMQHIHVVPRVWHSVVCDTVGPITRSSNGNTYILPCIDEFSGFLVAKTTSSHTALTFAKFLLEVALRYGFFSVVPSDLGVEFTGQITQHLLKMLAMKHLKNTAWKPTTTGVVERRHRTLGSQLTKLCAESQSDWTNHVPYAVFAMIASAIETTKVSPYKVMYGVECLFGSDSTFPIDYAEPFLADTHQHLEDIRAYAQFNLEESRRYNFAYNNPKRKGTPFKVNDQVLLFRPARSRGVGSKFHHYWGGPYDILQQTGPNNFRISYNRPGSNTGTVVSIARLKRYVRSNGSDEDLEEPDFDELHPREFRVIESSDDEAVPANDRLILATQVSRNATTAKLNEQHDDDAEEDDYITSAGTTVEPPPTRTNPTTRPNTLQLPITIARSSKSTTDETLPKSSLDNPRVRTPPRRSNIASKAMPPPLRIPDPRPVTPQAATTREATPRPRLETI
ncbi:hypothetical protein RvY_10759 [Ramazzottius varieornatus]|uniref:RNA-directed DNA polymerase n=1 Tax=Ramazzottius varieornatus TaxID=947166 RepID=A0A1D1VJ84_RAMVA|nr:hypothetical protein RvY_10759 [Ramazzottius varieornatus]